MSKKILVALLFSCLIISGCSTTPNAQVPLTASTLTLQPTPTFTKPPPTPTPQRLLPAITSTIEVHLPQPAISSPTKVSTLTVDAVDWVILDDKYVYWTELRHHQHIFRYPLDGGQATPLVTSSYDDGDLTAVKPIRRGDWLIFVDAQAPLYNTPFLLRALNLKTGREQLLLDGSNDQYSLPSLGATEDQVVWTTTMHTEQTNCTLSLLVLYDLRTQQQQELDHACLEDNYMWMFPSISKDYIVVEQDRPATDGTEGNTSSDIYLYSLAAKKITALTQDRHSGIPSISGPWVVWQNGARFELPKKSSIFNLNSGTRTVVDLGLYAIKVVQERWVYWDPAPGAAVYVYDLATQQFMIVGWSNGRVRQTLNTVAVYDNRIAW